MHNELEWIKRELVMACLKIVGGTEENHKEHQTG
jgi:hypothetical protein